MLRYDNNKTEACIAEVTFADSDSYGAAAQLEYRNSPVFSVGGISWRPKPRQKLLLVPCSGGMVCAGAMSETESLRAGELKLKCGEGYIHLKENGDVVINGVVITASGVIIATNT